MKGIPAEPDGPRGAWYRRVNETVARAATCTEVGTLLEQLGEPDSVEAAGDVISPSQWMARLGSRFRFGEENAEAVLTWIDPCRPSRRYRFGVVGGRVTGHWIETASG